MNEDRITKLESELEAIKADFYKNNFSSRQDFHKYCDFRTKLKVPHYDTLPATCEVGEVVESAGKLRICSAANTWTIVGTQS